jgi:hypothetical protein
VSSCFKRLFQGFSETLCYASHSFHSQFHGSSTQSSPSGISSLILLRSNTNFPLFPFPSEQTLQRASSVPARSNVPDKSKSIQPRHEQTQSQDQQQEPSTETPLTPSTTEESVAPTSMEPLLNLTKRNVNIMFEINGQQTLPNLPGIIPLQGHLHQQGWL